MMHVVPRILRVLLIVGLIPAVAVSGMRPPTCGCDVGARQAGCACRGSDGASCCDESGGGCPCCSRKTADPSPCAGTQDLEETASDGAAGIGCRCGGPAPVPTVPGSTVVELTVDAGLPAASFVAVVLPPFVPSSLERTRSALLPTPDLPTTLCALLI